MEPRQLTLSAVLNFQDEPALKVKRWPPESWGTSRGVDRINEELLKALAEAS